MSKQAFIKKSRKKKQTVKFLYMYEPILIFVRGWFKGQRIGKLHRHTPDIRAEFIDSADFPIANEVGHIIGFSIFKLGNAEPGGNMFTIRRTPVRIAGKRRTAAGDIDHLALGQNIVKILRKPDRPTVLQSLLASSFDS